MSRPGSLSLHGFVRPPRAAVQLKITLSLNQSPPACWLGWRSFGAGFSFIISFIILRPSGVSLRFSRGHHNQLVAFNLIWNARIWRRNNTQQIFCETLHNQRNYKTFFQIWITGCVRMRKNNTPLVHRGKEISQRWRNQRARWNARDTRFRRAGPTYRLHAPGNSPGWGILHQGNHLLLRKDIRDVDGENSRTIQTTQRTAWATLRRPVKTKKKQTRINHDSALGRDTDDGSSNEQYLQRTFLNVSLSTSLFSSRFQPCRKLQWGSTKTGFLRRCHGPWAWIADLGRADRWSWPIAARKNMAIFSRNDKFK